MTQMTGIFLTQPHQILYQLKEHVGTNISTLSSMDFERILERVATKKFYILSYQFNN